MFQNEELLNTFIELCGYGKNKPFECVGTYEEINFAITKTILELESKNKELPYMLKFYKQNYKLVDINDNKLIKQWNEENDLPEEFLKLLQDKIKEAVC